MEPDLVRILVALGGMCGLLMIRVCRDSERVALNTPQRFVKLIGPGLFLRVPRPLAPYEYTRVRIGDSGRYIGNGWAKIGGRNMPVQPVQSLEVDDDVLVKDFINQTIFAESCADRSRGT